MLVFAYKGDEHVSRSLTGKLKLFFPGEHKTWKNSRVEFKLQEWLFLRHILTKIKDRFIFRKRWQWKIVDVDNKISWTKGDGVSCGPKSIYSGRCCSSSHVFPRLHFPQEEKPAEILNFVHVLLEHVQRNVSNRHQMWTVVVVGLHCFHSPLRIKNLFHQLLRTTGRWPLAVIPLWGLPLEDWVREKTVSPKVFPRSTCNHENRIAWLPCPNSR